jgi:hypothetical protein
MVKSLQEIKESIMETRDLHVNCGSSSSNKQEDTMYLLSMIMEKYPEKIAEIEESIGEGEDFRAYFSDNASLKELKELRRTDPDRFYRILRKEELFLNTCLQTFGFSKYIISLNPDKLFSADFDDDEDELEE